MKLSNQHILEYLIINKDYQDNVITVKSFYELRNIIEDRYDKLGPGTKQNPIDFNDIDVSNIDSFCDVKRLLGLFHGIKFKYIDISEWNVSNVNLMFNMFYGCDKLKSVGDISDWDVSNVKSMCQMFHRCKELKSIGDISKWDVSNVTNMWNMFDGCESFNQDISGWNVYKVKFNSGIFDNCPIKEEYKPKFK